MPLKLMYITNRPDIALIAERNGVDRIFVDMEYIGKAERQGNLDTVKNHHSIRDISALRKVLTKSELLVRVNPIHEKTDQYVSSEEEIEAAIAAGADIVMLPYFKTIAEIGWTWSGYSFAGWGLSASATSVTSPTARIRSSAKASPPAACTTKSAAPRRAR